MRNRSKTVSQIFDKQFGTLSVKRGKGKSGHSLWSWDALSDCEQHLCPAAEVCNFLKASLSTPVEPLEKCKVMETYLKSVSTAILGNYEADLDEGQLFRVGMHIIPLYRNLVKMKIEELGIKRVISTQDNGRMHINPLYKEIREHIKLIEQMWKSVGIASPAVSSPSDENFSSDGTNYYEEMEKGAFADIHQQRGRKLSLVRRQKRAPTE